MERELYDNFLSILKHELIVALGCTEPIAVALASAKAAEVLGCFPDKAVVSCSGNIVKNVKSVTVPNSGGMKGIEIAAILGIVGGNADAGLEVLTGITDEHREKAGKLLKEGFCTCRLKENVANLYIDVCLETGSHSAEVTVMNHHTSIVKIVKDGVTVFEGGGEEEKEEEDKTQLSIKRIVEFADCVRMEDIEEMMERQMQYNTAISREGLCKKFGAQIGSTLLKTCGDSVRVKAMAAAAAGSDARMNGCALPVVINSGSGNQGMAVSLPVLEYAKAMGKSREEVCRSLVVSNLVSIHIKKYIGSLSAFCGAVSAGCGAGAAITYLHGGTLEQISNTIINTIANTGGILCDGAKASCAAKIASAVDAAILGHNMSMEGIVFRDGEGIVQEDVEKTIQSMGYIGRIGMKETDVQILKIMLGETVFA